MVFVTHSIDEALILVPVVLMSASPGRINREWNIKSSWPRILSPEMPPEEGIVNSLQVCSCANGTLKGGFITIEGRRVILRDKEEKK